MQLRIYNSNIHFSTYLYCNRAYVGVCLCMSSRNIPYIYIFFFLSIYYGGRTEYSLHAYNELAIFFRLLVALLIFFSIFHAPFCSDVTLQCSHRVVFYVAKQRCLSASHRARVNDANSSHLWPLWPRIQISRKGRCDPRQPRLIAQRRSDGSDRGSFVNTNKTS